MSAIALISGKLFREPESKVSKAGKVYGSATIRVGEGDSAQWWRLLCFSESGCEELLSLHDGDGLAVSGSFKTEPYEKRERDKERREQRQGPIDGPEAQRPIDDELNNDLPESWS